MEYSFTLNNGCGQFRSCACRRNSALKLSVTDWLADLPENVRETDLVEVQFKNTRKVYFHNAEGLPLMKGDVVVVEAANGYDIGEVTLVGKLVALQMQKNHIDLTRYEVRNILRYATAEDLRRRDEAKAKEQDTMIRARQLAKSLELQMKIGDVEYQGDGTKAIFYYIADERVDFRQLIKVYAETFRVRIEMKQIGARQEAGRIGGTGPCGRELCCATWMTNFHSVGTGVARLQNISPNPQKLAGQCAKLKCCLNFEAPVYEEAVSHFPSRDITLETKDGTYYYFSADPLRQEITYSSAPRQAANLRTISPERANEIIEMNRRGEKPVDLGGKQTAAEAVEIVPDYRNVVGQDDVTRFDKKRTPKQNKDRKPANNQRPSQNNSQKNNNRDKRPAAPANSGKPRPAYRPQQPRREN